MKRPLSMTGFGRGEAAGGGRKWTAELKSVNHRYLDIKIRMPRQFSFFEERIKKEIALYYSRGHIDLFLELAEENDVTARLKVDLGLAREYLQCLTLIRTELSLTGSPDLDLISTFRDVIVPVSEEDLSGQAEAIWPTIKEALAGALEATAGMRSAEGAVLRQDLLDRLARFAAAVARLEAAAPLLIKKRAEALQERLASLLAGVDLDPFRLAQEAAILVDKADVSEELVRLGSHIEQFRSFLEFNEPIGRRIDFLLQEFLRELNTIASKINDAEMAHLVVDLKNELEKMREQIQNLE